MKKTILLTGFAPFGGEQINPSWQAVQQLQGWQADDETEVQAIELPCIFGQSLEKLQQALQQFNPVLVIAVGQAGGRTAISLEKVAINYQDARIADNAGNQPLGEPVIAGAPTAYFSSLPLKAIVQDLRQQGIPAEISYSAGTFVCNHVFYGLMHTVATSPKVRAGFIHIPYLPAQAARLGGPASMTTELVVKALKQVMQLSLLQQPDILLAEGTLD
ncbi:pyroglutamyl-peptidase I [Rheinheimera sp. 4Y26]|uniref:pyroglutamyl-peptidase I n=1 Tax=Rheinheimera sp. 4Y26 TaxID=2977811 RepID=UPI0021B0D60A|nr:pyroglutamyl-peptidase I [Rheinheimera sp. 4Y26]MCT6699166.1 pyroglutamyl-peptidase I [Rheinheimera sp. 4Y26]